jgi:hypothetical protein
MTGTGTSFFSNQLSVATESGMTNYRCYKSAKPIPLVICSKTRSFCLGVSMETYLAFHDFGF